MKFGQNLYRNVVPEWQASYIDYKGLKKRIKRILESTQDETDPDLAPFIFSLDRELEKVDQFYNKRLADCTRKLKILGERHKEQFENVDNIPRHELEEHAEVLLELRGQLRKIAWFGDVNRRGFVKILKKLDKRLLVKVQQRYLNSKVLIKPFAASSEVTAAERTVNEWLEKLGLGIQIKGISETEKPDGLSFKNSSAGGVSGLSQEVLKTFDISIKNDNSERLDKALKDMHLSKDQFSQNLILNLLQRAAYAEAFKCIDLLLMQTESLKDTEDINERNLLHRIVRAMGRSTSTKMRNNLANYSELSVSFSRGDASRALPETPEEQDELPGSFDGIFKVLKYLLANFPPSLRVALTDRDAYGRIPLHYAAEYGIVQVCQTLTEYMHKWGQIDGKAGIDSSPWWDNEGLAPLHLAVIGQHPKTTKILLDAERLEGDPIEIIEARKSVSKSSAVLCLATRNNAPKLVELLVKAGVDVNFADESGESALFIAAKLGHLECARILLTEPETQKVDIEFAEAAFGWTPLFTAAVHGHAEVVALLLQYGADYERLDSSGWSAAEHATLRGHLKITAMIFDQSQPSDGSDTLSDTASTVQQAVSSLSTSPSRSLAEAGSPLEKAKFTQPNTKPIKTFGHRYIRDKAMVLVTLGSKDLRTPVDPVKLEQIPLALAHATQLDTALSLVVSAKGAEGEENIIDLPLQGSILTEPLVFETSDLSKVKLIFDLVPTYSGRNDKVLGRAVAVLNSLRPENAGGKVALQCGHTLPILEVSTLEVIGYVNFEFLVITPFSHENMSVTRDHTYWKTLTVPSIIGHRGLGKNIVERKSLQLGENTLQSFISAANLGAKYVEFDVQLTKDHVPVLYHDFLVSETGIDVPVHSLTLEQFLHLSEQQMGSSRPVSPALSDKPGDKGLPRRFRSLSVGSSSDDRTVDLLEKMKFTKALKTKGFNANTRGSQIQGPFQTLEGVFKNLPKDIGFNIELKYPMLDEAQAEEMDHLGIELNTWLDKILKIVYDHGEGRDIIFSSFHPDICLMASFKQPSIPVLFLTEGGTAFMSDIRASSLKEAIKFASQWNLIGIVSAAEPLVRCPRLIRVVKETGLVCVTYGTLNNDPENVKIQASQGIDAVIVDNVLAIRKGLTSYKDGSTPDGGKDGVKDIIIEVKA
ncbi:Glycerophosphocholine phosphodiesterase [Arthrobotrys conoides]|uniref:Glycerophosphocholine phosphodiesterase n=1 Tax=Arthrobotrys conoides TaxID=74498 RepID=A0AAN8NGN5_9PEZI